ncbi:MAG TPA: hypothetical protein VFH31_07185, partial [Pyrinomonadaceae bacterium]|nr:hypothetical protein [Pyrinomonadaceae bacterium]
MLRKVSATFRVLFFVCFASCIPAYAASLSPTLQQKLTTLADTANVGTVIVAFNTSSGLNDSHLATLSSLGISRGLTLQQLGMVAVPAATAAQVRALAANPAVRSVWSNDRLQYFMDQGRVLTGINRIRTDAA